jgi:hypothetical protein
VRQIVAATESAPERIESDTVHDIPHTHNEIGPQLTVIVG